MPNRVFFKEPPTSGTEEYFVILHNPRRGNEVTGNPTPQQEAAAIDVCTLNFGN